MNDTLIIEATKDTVEEIGSAMAHTLAIKAYDKFKGESNLTGKWNIYRHSDKRYVVFFETNNKIAVLTYKEARAITGFNFNVV